MSSLPHPMRGIGTDNSLSTLPEIERENILAGRLEEMQKFKDSQNLDAMYRMAGGGGDEDEDEEDEPRKRRKLAFSRFRVQLTRQENTQA
jgi:RNA polymerase-associated protein RTF1